MTQRTSTPPRRAPDLRARVTGFLPPTAGARPRRSPSTDPRVHAELAVIVDRRITEPPAPASVRPHVRPFVPADRAAVEAMAARCSEEALHHRFHGPPRDLRPERVADQLLRGRRAEHLVAEAGGAVVGLASLYPTSGGDAELAVLVEDAWQHTGLGHRLTGHALRLAARHGVRDLVADVLREPRYVVERLVRSSADASVSHDGAVTTVRIPVAAVRTGRDEGGPVAAGVPARAAGVPARAAGVPARAAGGRAAGPA